MSGSLSVKSKVGMGTSFIFKMNTKCKVNTDVYFNGLKDDDPLEQCILFFWDSLEDEIYPKSFLESLLQMVDDIATGKEKVIPIDDVMKNLKTWLEEEDDEVK